ncbi:peptidoglycan DD-metalloendopeptidase family protein [Streptomyces sp. NPDC005481]|uniref:murein hydrolase activator EnvC family protein n=1 Tax=Streptomyces sp. NPDC005481 TaxID=3154881 RepID=UPI0033BCCDE8
MRATQRVLTWLVLLAVLTTLPTEAPAPPVTHAMSAAFLSAPGPKEAPGRPGNPATVSAEGKPTRAGRPGTDATPARAKSTDTAESTDTPENTYAPEGGAAGPPGPHGMPGAPGIDVSVPAVGRAWPVGGRPGPRPWVLRGWEPPVTAYGRGHRGVDLAAAPGDPVRAVAPGRVSFAGRVAGRGVVSVELSGTGDPPLRTTYGPVEPSVKKGDEVAAGAVLGTLGPATDSHCATTCLHWGLLRGGTYVNPLSLLPPWLLRAGPPRLLPVP